MPQSRHKNLKKFFAVLFILSILTTSQASYAATFSIMASATPSSGVNQLQDVDLTATVSGTATGDITYYFDCQNDGTWERIITTSSQSYTAFDLCDYSSSGNYTAKVFAQRSGFNTEATTGIIITSSSTAQNLSILKQVRNVSRNQSIFIDLIAAKPLEKVEFQIKITALGDSAVSDVIVKDTLPGSLTYLGNLKVDGNVASGNIFSGLAIGNVLPNQAKTITFEAQLKEAQNFPVGTTNAINTALALNERGAWSDAVTIQVDKSTGVAAPTQVSTGMFGSSFFLFLGAFLLSLTFASILLLRFYFKTRVLPYIFQDRTERELIQALRKIKRVERK